ncbi:MAG: hypothetical protein MSA90_14880 [Faecalicatena sp.]|uniref:hypothetical protein n=1 Tax=Faecalicatena sp. TaxID=2005360 RepID=UPI00258CA89E|nr:hypothetical protein [Faecalicatena sp.]MCI6466735.1 hypothetical protein [Faecalicatena sp.]MCI7181974.1 hypothetical protein [Lachnospiraceae bacterium]MDY5619125.1 hypothetical protein [Lachnospiraceae bacterium]
MKRFRNNKTVWLTAAAVIMAGSMTIHSALAYFTANASAQGGHPISLGSKTDITEDFSDWTKHIEIANTGENDCYIRVKVFSGSQFDVEFSGESGAWSQGDDEYWYYSEIVPAGGKTSVLNAKINVPADFEDDFNVVVIQECTPVQFDENGKAYADWTQKIDTTSDFNGEEAGE